MKARRSASVIAAFVPRVVYERADFENVYERADFENVWLGGSAGSVYVSYPDGVGLPASIPNLDQNW